MLFHRAKTAISVANPPEAIAMPYATLSAAMYDERMPGSCSSVKLSRNPEAPTSITAMGLTDGASLGKWPIKVFVNAACAAETINAPPVVWKTVLY